MHRLVSSTIVFSLSAAFALALGACSSDDESRHDHDGYDNDPCSGISTCGACTPVVGCGWCSYSDGTGACAQSAAQCGGETFRWNWEPTGCPGAVVVDSGPPSDSASDAPKSDATPSDASVDANDANPSDASTDAAADVDESTAIDAPVPVCNVPTAGLNGCVSTTGGSLCSATQYTLACHASGGSTPSPDASLKCTLAVSDTGGSFYCCPCASGT